MLLDDQGAIREKFAIGDTMFLSAQGLLPCTTFTFSLGRKGHEDKRELLARYVSDRHGTLPMTVLIPHFGLLHPGSEPSYLTHEEAAKIFAGQPYTIHIAAIKQEASFSHTLRFTIDDGLDRNPRVFASDRHGRLVTGFEVGDSEIGVTLRNFPPGCARIFVVPRQFDWRVGDPVEPVRMRIGAPVGAT